MSNSKSFADYLSGWFSDYEPIDKNLHTKLALFLSFIFIYTGLAIQKSRSWFFWDQPFDSPTIGRSDRLLITRPNRRNPELVYQVVTICGS